MAVTITPANRPPRAERVEIVQGQIAGFKRELYAHELNLARLNGLPADLRGQDHDATVAAEERAIRQIQSAIDSTKTAAQTDPTT